MTDSGNPAPDRDPARAAPGRVCNTVYHQHVLMLGSAQSGRQPGGVRSPGPPAAIAPGWPAQVTDGSNPTVTVTVAAPLAAALLGLGPAAMHQRSESTESAGTVIGNWLGFKFTMIIRVGCQCHLGAHWQAGTVPCQSR